MNVASPMLSPIKSAHPLRELTLSRLRLFFREPGAVFWTFGFPLLLTVALGAAFRNRPPEPVRVGVFDALSPEGVPHRDLLRELRASPELRVSNFDGPTVANEALRTGKVDLIVLTQPTIQFVFDPSRPESRLARALADAALHPRGPPETVDKPVTEPGSRYVDFLIPGLIGMNIMSSGMWGIGYVVVEMRTRKLLKRLVATPMSRAQFLTSFVLMRALFLFLELPVLLGFGWLAFKVGVAGSLPLLVGVGVLGALSFAGIGLLVASRARNTQTVSGLINLVMLPIRALPGGGAALPARAPADRAQRFAARDHDRRRRPARHPRTDGAARRNRGRQFCGRAPPLPLAMRRSPAAAAT